ncbi:MAG TPA: hypothetical protein PKG81_04890, partial [Candidatus Omnitrophota bacterium]|nr:hypothetical protein [Candidatus Omnitrophota bacterium]
VLGGLVIHIPSLPKIVINFSGKSYSLHSFLFRQFSEREGCVFFAEVLALRRKNIEKEKKF